MGREGKTKMQNNPYSNYQQQSVMTMTGGEMLVKLYDEVIRQMNIAKRSIADKDIAATNLSLQKCQRIINYLDNTLDDRYSVSASLSSLYEFFIRQLVEANIKKDDALLDDIIPMIAELRDTFVQAEKLSRMGQQPAVQPSGLVGAVG